MAHIGGVNAVLLLGLLALISHGVEGARRDLADTDNNAASPRIVDVTTFGAKADEKFDNFPPFVKAWKEVCGSHEPAKMVIPPGIYKAGPVLFVGPCNNTAPIIEIQGTVIASTDISEFASPEWFLFDTINGLTLTGTGTLDGKGGSVWKSNDCGKNPSCASLPTNVKFQSVSNSIISGISSVDSKGFHFHITDSKNITANNIKITAPGESPNTDGIHLSNTDLVNFNNMVIRTGDDCISIGQGATNVTISNITCGPGHGISVGSLGKVQHEEDVNGIVVSNCTLTNTTNGLRIKTWPGSPPSLASNIHFQDIVLNHVKNPILIDQHYGCKKPDPSKVKISDVSFKNVKGSSVSVLAVSLNCSEAVPCEGVELADIDLTFTGNAAKGALFSSACENAKVTYGGKQSPPPCKI